MACIAINDGFHSYDKWNTFINSFDFVLTDCDGVIWIGDELLPGSADTFKLFRQLGKQIAFVTNNSTKCIAEYLVKFKKLGVEAHEKELFSSSYCVASHLQTLGFKKKVYLVGSPGVAQELEKINIKYLPIGPDPIEVSWLDSLKKGIELDKEVGAVVVAFDDHISFLKIAKAISYLKDPNCLYIASNTDEQFPSKGNKNIITPGTGTIVAAVTTGAERTPVVLGKPFPFMFDCIKKNFPDVVPERCLMIGDRLNTDIAFGRVIGAQTLLTLSGVTSQSQLNDLKDNPDEKYPLPNYVVTNLGDLNKYLSQTKIP